MKLRFYIIIIIILTVFIITNYKLIFFDDLSIHGIAVYADNRLTGSKAASRYCPCILSEIDSSYTESTEKQ